MNRRALLGGAVALPALAVAAVPTAATAPSTDFRWTFIVTDFRRKYAAWDATIGGEDEMIDVFREARASLGPEPQKPGVTSSVGMLDKTLRELRDACDAPESKAAWAAWERDHGAWKEREAELRERIVGPANARYDGAYKAYDEALAALSSYPVRSLADLAEKIEIVAADYDGAELPLEYLADFLADVRRLSGQESRA